MLKIQLEQEKEKVEKLEQKNLDLRDELRSSQRLEKQLSETKSVDSEMVEDLKSKLRRQETANEESQQTITKLKQERSSLLDQLDSMELKVKELQQKLKDAQRNNDVFKKPNAESDATY